MKISGGSFLGSGGDIRSSSGDFCGIGMGGSGRVLICVNSGGGCGIGTGGGGRLIFCVGDGSLILWTGGGRLICVGDSRAACVRRRDTIVGVYFSVDIASASVDIAGVEIATDNMCGWYYT